jgi:hypothetical protein
MSALENQQLTQLFALLTVLALHQILVNVLLDTQEINVN